jgi:molybdopterin-guanine dinucleotide biosynthesis protein A
VYDALVLAGGAARRMGGVDKPALTVGGATLLDRVLRATEMAAATVVVGPERATCRRVLWTREEPLGGGPVAALAAGLELVSAEVVALLAADLPFLDSGSVLQLVQSAAADGGAVMVEGEHPQWLCGAWRTAALRGALAGTEVSGARLRDVLGPLAARRVSWRSSVPGRPAPWTDCDTEDDLARARENA